MPERRGVLCGRMRRALEETRPTWVCLGGVIEEREGRMEALLVRCEGEETVGGGPEGKGEGEAEGGRA